MPRKPTANKAVSPTPAPRGAPVERAALSIRHVAQSYDLSVARVYELIAEGQIRAVKCGGKTLIPVASAENWFSALPSLVLSR